MTVVSTINAYQRQFGRQAYADREQRLALPISVWAQENLLVGDGTGGLHLQSITQNNEVSQRMVCSLEGVNYGEQGAGSIIQIQWATGDEAGLNNTGYIETFLATAAGPTGAGVYPAIGYLERGGSQYTSQSLPSRLFIRRAGITSLMEVRTISLNAGAGNTKRLYAWGYNWDKDELDHGKTLVRPT